MKKWITAVAASGICVSLTPSVAQADPPPMTPAYAYDCGHKSIRPAEIVITCADANNEVVDIDWSVWSTETALGRGVWTINPCIPYCAVVPSSKWKRTPVSVVLTERQDDGFMLMVLTDGSGRNTVVNLRDIAQA
ncbi:hypothetical protein [Tsukamurella soli]|uniref:Secreted protein n=1 Tax=Tsukamurella soli TaxID=644556 RepID=A0ABP8KBF8_9ACTN